MTNLLSNESPETELARLRQELADARQQLERTQDSLTALQRQVDTVRDLGVRMVESSPDCIKTIGLDGRLRWLSHAGMTLFHCADIDALNGVPWVDFWQGEDRAAAEAAIATARAGGVGRFDGFCPTLDGEPRWWSVALVNLIDANGEVEGLLGITRDISALKQVEKALERRNQLDKLFLGAISHDLRSPLQSMLLGAEILRESENLDESQRSNLDRMIWSGERARRLIQDLLDFTRSQLLGGIPIAVAECDLGELVARVVDEVSAVVAPARIEARCDEPVSAMVDHDRVAQLVGNLLHNAVLHGATGSSVTVRLGRSDDHATIAVHNHGPAIPADEVAVMFDPLARRERQRGKPAGDGLGLGLYICQAIVHGHGGSIEIESNDDGTTFCVKLPLTADSQAAEQA